MSSKIKQYFLPAFFFLLFSFLYIHNLSRSVYGGDVGDFVTAAKVFGVAHPPGYPLFTFLGFILTRFNIFTPAFMVGLISVFSSVFAVILYYLFSLELTKNKFIAFVSTLVLGFNFLFWFYAEIAEVFALNNFFVICLLFLSFLYFKYKKTKYIYLLSFFVGLSLTNHQTIIFIFPTILILVLTHFKKIFTDYKLVIKSIFLVLLGFSVYLYIPLASSHNPIVNWDNVKDLNSFLHLLLRKDYGTFQAGAIVAPSLAERFVILKAYFEDILTQLTIPVLILSILGALSLLKKEKRFLISLLIGFILSGPFFIGYAGFPLVGSFFMGIYERFFVMSSIIILIFFPIGILTFVNFINKIFKKKSFQNLFIGIFLIIPFSLFYYNFPKTDLHNVWIGDDLAYDMLSPLPKNSVFLLAGDTPLFNAWYVHYGLNFRPDTRVVNLDGLAGDAYFGKKISDYLKKHPKERNDKDLVANVIVELSKEVPIFSHRSIRRKKGEALVWIPYGLGYKLLKNKSEIPSEEEFLKTNLSIWNSFRFYKNDDKNNIALGNLTISDLPTVYASSLLSIGNFVLNQYKDIKGAYTFFEKARLSAPNYYKTYEVLGVYFSDRKDCRNTEANLNKAIGMYPFDKITYYILYASYKTCSNNLIEADRVVKEYEKTYGTDFFKDLKNDLKNK